MGWVVTTVSGHRVDVHQSPNPKSISLDDIAHALSLTCRYNGQIKVFYNVADHCIAVAHAVYKVTRDKRKALEGLLHDAHEAYTGDMVYPVKQHLKDQGGYGFDFLEHYVAGSIMMKYGLPEITVKTEAGRLYIPSEAVKDMDDAAYRHESYCLNRPDPASIKLPELFEDVKTSDPEKSKKNFLKTFRRYHANWKH